MNLIRMDKQVAGVHSDVHAYEVDPQGSYAWGNADTVATFIRMEEHTLLLAFTHDQASFRPAFSTFTKIRT